MNWPALAWVVFGLVGLVRASKTLSDAYRDRRLARAARDATPEEVIVARSTVIARRCIVTGWVCIVVLGVPSLLPVPFRIDHRQSLYYVSLGAAYGIELALALANEVSVWARERIRQGKVSVEEEP